MRRAILWPLFAFIGTWALILIFDAWGSLHWPNPLEWDRFSRMMALYIASAVSFGAWLFWFLSTPRGRP